MRTYASLWCKTNYSFLEGASHPEELVETAGHEGLAALAVTDRNGVYGVVRAYEKARTLGVPLILGAEVAVDPGATLVLLAQTREGYAHLCALLTKGHRDRAKGEFGVTWAQVAEHSGDLVALWRPEPAPGSRDPELGLLADAYGERLYAMVSRHRWVHDARREAETLAWARKYQISSVAVTEVLYHRSDRQGLQDTLTCIRHRVRLSEAGTRLRPNAEHDLKTDRAFRDLYADHPDWVDQTLEIADRCRFSLAEIEYLYPDEGVPSNYDTAGWLRHLTFEGAAGRYPEGLPQPVADQLEKELALIGRLRYSGYFLTMWEIVRICQVKGILCQGRGSAANSAVCYCLGITAINPMKVDLLFERFLSQERAEPPDIDLDIEHHRREEVIQHMYQRYGRHRAAMVANVVRYRSRSALREVGKVLGISEVALDQGAKLLSHHDEGIAGALKDAGFDSSLGDNRRLVELAAQLNGFPRHLSIHPGGFLLGSEALDRIVPVENATMKDRTVIQWDKTDIETMNLFKVDLLGLGALTHLDYAFRLLQQHHGRALSLASIPQEDSVVYDMVCRADTVGVFQIESRAQMSMLPRLKPRTYYDLVVEVSLVRPGPITGGMVHPYLRRRSGLEAVTYPHESLIPILKKTQGIPLFQEQVMKLAMVAADYSPGEADQLRRDMAAWRSAGRIEQHHDTLVGRMVAKGIEKEFAERVFDQIRGFGEYGFPESHAASFALIAYATAYLKCHYPDVFACALLNAWPMGFYAPATIVGDARRHGVRVLPVDLLCSEWDCTLEQDGNEPSRALRMGLRYIQGLARAEVARLVAFRDQEGARVLADWKARCRVSADTWEKLAVSGALEGFGVHRRNTLWDVLDPGGGDPLGWQFPRQDFAGLSAGERVGWDYQSTGLSPQAHLLEGVRLRLQKAGYAAASKVSLLEPGRRVEYAGLVICRQSPSTARGVMFLTLEDETGIVNLVVWKGVWTRFRKVILTSGFLGVSGIIQSEEGVVHVVADRFWSPEGLVEPGTVPIQAHDFH